MSLIADNSYKIANCSNLNLGVFKKNELTSADLVLQKNWKASGLETGISGCPHSEQKQQVYRSCGNNYIGFKFIFITYKARTVRPKCIDI